MCGICGMLVCDDLTDQQKEELKLEFYKSSCKIRHRGPDRTISHTLEAPVNVCGVFHRLAIMDPSTKGDQPFRYEEGSRSVYVMCNGEIYGYKKICEEEDFKLQSGSDCEVIPKLYQKYGIEGMDAICKRLNSEHAFSILDVDMKSGDYKLILSSDRFGLRPLFTKTDSKGFYYSSELQGLPNLKSLEGKVERFPPRHYGIIEKKNGILGEMKYHKYYTVRPKKILHFDLKFCLESIQSLLEIAIIERLASDRPFGCLLSGGLDSSLVAAIASKYLKKFGKRLRTFSIGLPGGTDEIYAKMVAEFIDSDHTHILVSEEDFLKTFPLIAKIIGTIDITTIRASTGQYLVSKWISENTDIKVLLCGDQSDECFSGYIYFHKAPNPEAGHDENIRLLEDIHMYDGLRADRCMSHFGIEARFPFADHRLNDFVLRCDPALRVPTNGKEKWLLRSAFKDLKLLPDEVLWRDKCAFSDGVSSRKKSWYQIIQEHVETLFTDMELEESKIKYKHLPPITKESLYGRKLFCEEFGENETVAQTIPYFWLPKWVGDLKEPSARILEICKG